MPIMRLRSVGRKGVNTDLPSFDLQPSDWSDANNVRFQADRVQKIGGSKSALLNEMPNEVPLALVQKPITEDLLYGTTKYDQNHNPLNKGSLWRAQGITHSNISKRTDQPVLGADGQPVKDENGDIVYQPYEYMSSAQFTWDYTTLSNTVVFNTRLDDPQGIAPNDKYFSDLPGWGVSHKPAEGEQPVKHNWKANRIRAYKNYLLALGTTEDNEEHQQRVRWSDIAYTSTLPQNWYDDSDENDGGFNDLTDSQSHIIDGKPLRDSFVVYTNQDTFIMDYVGGTMIFNFRKIFSDSGILAPNCAVEFEGQHFVISEDDIFVHNGSTRQSVATGRIKERLMSEISSVNYLATKVFAYPSRKEIWIMYAGPGSSTNSEHLSDEEQYACNRAAVWSWQYDTWSFTDLPNIYDINMGLSPDIDSRAWSNQVGRAPDEAFPGGYPTRPGDDIWTFNNEGAVDRTEEVWEEFSQTFTKHQMFSASADKCFYLLDVGYYWETFNSTGYWLDTNPNKTRKQYLTKSPVVCYVERQALDFDEQEPDISYQKWWRGVYPQMTGRGSVTFFFGGSSNPSENPTWDSNSEFIIGEDFKVDCFINYRYPAIRIVDSAEGDWSMTGYDIEYFREGNR